MKPEEIHERLKAKFGDKIREFHPEALDPWAKVAPEAITEVARYLKTDPDLLFSSLMCLSGVDYGPGKTLGVVYHLYSMNHRHQFVLKVDLPRDSPHLPSVESVWKTANWHEREAFDLFGIRFDGHPDLRRIFLPDDWEGHPLRKDYAVQEFYHGIRVPYAEDWTKMETYVKNPDRGTWVFEFEEVEPKKE